jgi:glucose-6-phosphate 1-dehydrogenase
MKTLVLFGASGDLAKEKLFPALYENYKEGLTSKYIGYGRSNLSDIAFKERITKSIGKKDKKFLSNFSYIQGTYDQNGLKKLNNIIDPSKTIFYLAIPNRLDIVENLINGLNQNKLIGKDTQLVIEKPFGEDYKSAKTLRDFLKKEVGEEKIYPIDHYLAKDLVRNLITLRFANPVFENLWNNKFIKKIDIDIKEKDGIKDRGEYYDKAGAIKDMIQNHGLQLLSLITFNQPSSFNSEDFHLEKEKVLKNTHVYRNDFKDNIKIGQYKNYLKEKDVTKESKIETSASINFEVDNKKWKGVPIKITTGKKLNQKLTSIKIYFKPLTNCLWENKCDVVTKNTLTINIYPRNNIELSINTEFKPNLELPKTKSLELGFPKDNLLNLAYSNALKDIYNKEKSYTPSFNEILYSWKIIDDIEEFIDKNRDNILKIYE